MEFSTMTAERISSGSLQFQKTNHVLSSAQCLETNNAVVETRMYPANDNNGTTNNSHHHDDEQTKSDITQILEALLANLESENYPVITATTSQNSIYDNCTKVSLITPLKVDEADIEETKDIVMLRNLEITPPPQDPTIKATPSPNSAKAIDGNTANKRRSSKRTHSEQSDESLMSVRSKRQRKQTELFQVESVQKPVQTRKQPKPEVPQVKPEVKHTEEPKFQDVIFYERGDHLAIRNEENTFFLCQLTENVRVQKPFVKVRWLDTEDDGQTYFLTSHYDKVPQKSIIMPVELGKLRADKKKKQLFTIDDQAKNSVLDRLKRSINMPAE